LAGLAEGRLIIGVAWQGAEHGAPLNSQADGAYIVLQGERRWVYPARADGWLVVTDDDGIFWAPADTEQVTSTTHARVDGSLCATLRFEQTRLAASHQLAQGETVKDAVAHTHSVLRVLQAAELLGI